MTYLDLEAEFEEFLSTYKEDDEREQLKPVRQDIGDVIPGLAYRLAPDTSWMSEAACRGLGPDLFFPEQGDGNTSVQAKIVCRGCPVQEECLNFALDYNVEHGVWGGETDAGLRRARKARNVQKAA